MKTIRESEGVTEAQLEGREISEQELETVSGGFSPAFIRMHQLEGERRRQVPILD